ncbi:MlaD family protein [Candidatus Accumulibacter sp. ACC007]|uniref:PqiB family protein n=1 Tax=Candidatus Accumulibacter sp. ACC007 TaxID=2823333 RepID=UPI0025C005E8|nr:MlaD family protein [Candidatus Accumulibacter sp. ACC007]
MTDRNDHDALPQATVVRKKRTRISVVWIIPILAAVVAVGIAIQQYLSEGPTISIVFKTAVGIEAGKTFIKYKDVNIGQVTAVQLADDYSRVMVTAKIAKSAAGLMVEDAKFWVVEPRVSLSGVSGLGTLLSGNYIGFEAGKSDSSERSFTGLAVAPIITRDQLGRPFVLKALHLGSLGIGSPIYYRRLQAGQVVGYNLSDDGKAVEIKVFVNAPYDQYVSPGTRFWNASGLDVSIGAGGVDVRTQSMAALIAGGLAFETPHFAPKAEPAAAHTEFTLYGDQLAAMAQAESVATRYVLYFKESLRGLSVGAPVTLLGLEGGSVTDVGLDLDPKTLELRGRVEVVAYPERLIASLSAAQKVANEAVATDGSRRQELIRRMIEERGLRAQLRSGSLLTGQLYVAFEYFPKAARVKVNWRADPVELPVAPSTLPHLEQRVTSIMAKIDAMPLEAIGDELSQSMVALNRLLKDTDRAVRRIDADVTPELKKALEDFRRATVSADQMIRDTDATLLGPDAPGQQDLREALREVARAARSLRVLTDYLERHPEALVRGKN